MTGSSTLPVREAPHDLGGNTKGFYLSDKGKDIFFTVTEPEYNKPKGTILYFHGTGEFSELMSRQIEQWTDAGYRVVTFDQPGAGLSTKDAKIGTSQLVHVNSIPEASEAAQLVVDHVQNTYRDSQNGRLHFVAYGEGALVALDAASKLGAGRVGSLTGISPLLDIDLSVSDWTRSIGESFRESTTPDPVTRRAGALDQLNGPRVNADRAAFLAADVRHQNRAGEGPWTMNTRRAIDAYLNVINPSRDDYVGIPNYTPDVAVALRNNGVKVAFLTDPEHELASKSAQEWSDRYGVNAEIITIRNGGIDMHRNPDTQQRVLAAIEENIDGCLFVKVANGLKTVSDAEWGTVSEAMRKNMQRDLVAMGYDVGKFGIDGVPRHGAIADTEHAMTRFLMTYLDKKGVDIQNFVYSPENVIGAVSMARKEGFKMPDEVTLRTDPAYDVLKKYGEVDHGADGHHLTVPGSRIRP